MRREKIKKTISGDQFDFGSVQSISEWTFALPTPAPTLLAFALAFSYNLAFRSRFTLLKLSYLPTLSLRPFPRPSPFPFAQNCGRLFLCQVPGVPLCSCSFSLLYFLGWYCCRWDWLAPFPTALDFFERVLMKIDMAGTCVH